MRERAPLRRPMIFRRLARAACGLARRGFARKAQALAHPLAAARRLQRPLQGAEGQGGHFAARQLQAGNCPWGARSIVAMTWTWRQAGRARPGPCGPPDQTASSPWVCSISCPCGCRVFHGVPRTCQHGSGPLAAAVLQRHAHLAQLHANLCQQGLWVQQVALIWSRRPFHDGRSCHSSRPGRAALSRLAPPPVKTSWADPGQMVPRAWVSCTCPPVAAPALRQPLRWREGDDGGQHPAKAPATAQPRCAPLSSAVRASATVPCRARRHRQNGAGSGAVEHGVGRWLGE